MKTINVVVTSGGTREHIDEVRVLTNISSGKLSAIIAEEFAKKNSLQRDVRYKIHYIYAKSSIIPFQSSRNPDARKDIILHEISDVKDLLQKIVGLISETDVFIHAMAVSDFGFRKTNVKLRSNNEQEFIESMRSRIYKNPKVLAELKKWNPEMFLVSFKFEVGTSHSELIKIATKSMNDNKCDLVIANDKKEMTNNKAHIAYIVDKQGNETLCKNKQDIACKIVDFIEDTSLVSNI